MQYLGLKDTKSFISSQVLFTTRMEMSFHNVEYYGVCNHMSEH